MLNTRCNVVARHSRVRVSCEMLPARLNRIENPISYDGIAKLFKNRSPDAHIENAFSKLKAMLRARAERKIDALWDAVGTLIPRFTSEECANYFRAAGYDPD